MADLMEIPQGNWLERLRKGNRVWLPKENCEGCIYEPYQPPEPGERCGRITLNKVIMIVGTPGMRYTPTETWYVYPNGKGFDGTQLIIPIVGQLPENPPPLNEPWQRKVERAIEILATEIDGLKAQIMVLENANNPNRYSWRGVIRELPTHGNPQAAADVTQIRYGTNVGYSFVGRGDYVPERNEPNVINGDLAGGDGGDAGANEPENGIVGGGW